ncbi:MAG: GreA/GreB family elongation factor [Patescibacteria group bacterium]
MFKEKLKKELLDKLKKDLLDNKLRYKKAKEAAIDSPGRMQSRYDSSKEEFNYEAEAIQKRIFEIKKNIEELENLSINFNNDNINIGSVIKIKINDEIKNYFISPAGGGEILNNDIMVITPLSPIGKILLDKKENESINFNDKKIKIIEIL